MKFENPRTETDGDDPFAETSVSFSTLESSPGFEVIDPIDRHRFSMRTSAAVSPTPAPTDVFPAPVDEAREIETEHLEYDGVYAVYLRDDAGALVAETERFAEASFPPGVYSLELTAPIKLYLRVDSPVTISTDATRTRIDFDTTTTVTVGARSRHQHPAGTVTTTDDPRSMMTAVTSLASALKTTTPERTYPTLRGHPPLLELGDSLDVPAGLEGPETGVTLEIPPTYESVFAAAPLAYYLGATVRPGESPRLVTDTGFEYSLASGAFDDEVARVLKQLFFLDCVTRTEGYYQIALHERRAVEADLDLDLADLYHAPLAEQVATYLRIPYRTVEEHVPEWKLTTHVTPTPDSVEYLPFVVNELAIVRTQPDPQPTSSVQQATAIDAFTRDEFTRSATSTPAGAEEPVVQPETSDGLSQAWIGEGAPAGASKPSLEAYRHKLEREPTESDISIAVVTNDEAMAEELVDVETVYGSRSDLPYDVTFHGDLTVDELAVVLTTDLDFVHYIGHVERDGIRCRDGKLDVTDLDAVGVDSFLLNACRSYHQGMALIERGAVGGVVTLREVVNSGAVEIGRTMARLLNRGFPLQAALDLAKDQSVIGQQYIVVGDGELAIAQAESGTPNYCDVEPAGAGFDVEYRTYPTSTKGIGSVIMPYTGGDDVFYLNGGTLDTFRMTERELEAFLELEDIPLKIDGDLRWSDEVSVSDL